MNKANYKALLPIGVFLVLYLGLGIVFEYVLKIPMGFYNIPIVVVFLIALLVACVQNPKLNFDAKLELMAKGVGDKNIITMVLIFMTAEGYDKKAPALFARELSFLFMLPQEHRLHQRLP